jgi:hypothetical protein
VGGAPVPKVASSTCVNDAPSAWWARSRTQPLVVLGLVLLVGAIALLVAVPRSDHSSRTDSAAGIPPTELLIPVAHGVYGFDQPPSPALVRYARTIYRANWESCQQRWSVLLAHAGEPLSRRFSRSALRQVAPKLPYYPRAITFDGLLNRIANEGCVAGFLYLLESHRSYALS